jgi:hypothetical protein
VKDIRVREKYECKKKRGGKREESETIEKIMTIVIQRRQKIDR